MLRLRLRKEECVLSEQRSSECAIGIGTEFEFEFEFEMNTLTLSVTVRREQYPILW